MAEAEVNNCVNQGSDPNVFRHNRVYPSPGVGFRTDPVPYFYK